MAKQFLFGASTSNIHTSGTQSMCFWGIWAPGVPTHDASGVAIPCGLAGTWGNPRVILTVAPGAGTTRTFTWYKNGVAQTMACAFGAASTDVTDSTHTISVAAGDYIECRGSLTGTPAGAIAYFAIEFTPTSNTQQCLFGGGHAFNSASRFNSAGSGYSFSNTTEPPSQAPAPLAGTLNAFYAHTSGNPGGTGGYDPQVDQNGGAMTGATVALHSTTTDASATGLSLAFAVGDLIDISVALTGTANTTDLGTCLVYTPATAGQSMVLNTDLVSLLNSAERYSGFAGNFSGMSSVQGTFKVLAASVNKWVMSNLYVHLTSSPNGAGKSYTFNPLDGGSALKNTVTITNAATTGQDNAHQDTIGAGDYIEMSITPANTPSSSTSPSWGFVQSLGHGGGKGHKGHRGGNSGSGGLGITAIAGPPWLTR